MSDKLYAGLWNSCDSLAWAEISTLPPDGPWPAMVRLQLDGPDCDFSFDMTADDARDLMGHLGAAVDRADLAMRAALAGAVVEGAAE